MAIELTINMALILQTSGEARRGRALLSGRLLEIQREAHAEGDYPVIQAKSGLGGNLMRQQKWGRGRARSSAKPSTTGKKKPAPATGSTFSSKSLLGGLPDRSQGICAGPSRLWSAAMKA